MDHDDRYMKRALRLASLGRHASPNPMVGCVIVSPHGHIIGEGYHHAPGTPHAEVWALRSAGEYAEGSTVYVTLEPCSHFGRTPPCADALIDAKVSKVVVAMPDPDNRVSGNGIAKLKNSGIHVQLGVLEEQARRLNAAFIKHRTTGIPWVVLKSAMTLDGKIATSTGDSRWITSTISRTGVHRQLRDRCDAILTGVSTIIADNSSLTTRLKRNGRNPLRIVVDSRGTTPADANVVRLSAEDGKTIIAVTDQAPQEKLATLSNLGCQIILCDTDNNGRVSLRDLILKLGARGDIICVIVEAGGNLSASLLREMLVDRWLLYIAPKIIGGDTAPGPIGDLGVQKMQNAVESSSLRIRRSGCDIVIDNHFWVE